MLWDIFEDVVIFRIGAEHWKIKNIGKQTFSDFFYSTIGKNVHLQNLEKEFKILNNFLKQKKVRAKDMIDFCCGDGKITEKIAKIVGSKEIWGVDLNEKLLEKCKERNIKTIKHDMKKKIFLRKKFELTVCYGSLHHFDCPEKIVRDVAKYSRKYVLIIDKCRYSKSFLSGIIHHFDPFELGTNILPHEKILEIVRANNIKIIDWKIYSNIHPFSDLIYVLGRLRR
jgi:SAM-dependent methyltransferase